MNLARAPSSPPLTTHHHHTKEQAMHYSSSSTPAPSSARSEGTSGIKAGHPRDNGVPNPARDLATAAYEDVTGTRRGRHRHPGPTRYAHHCMCCAALRTVAEHQRGVCNACPSAPQGGAR